MNARALTRWILLIAVWGCLAVMMQRPELGLRRVPLPSKGAVGAVEGVDFERLGGFELALPEIIENEQGLYVHADTPFMEKVPLEVRRLDGALVSVAGYMQPITLNRGKVAEFLLLRDRDTCCFGGTPQVNHWISVRMTNGPVPAKLGRPVTVTGRLAVRELRMEGVIVGLYALAGGEVEDWKTPAKASTPESAAGDSPTVISR